MEARKSDAIVREKVLSKSCERDEHGRIYTKIQLLVGEVWKGPAALQELVIVQGGGVLGEERVIVTGQVQYDIGEDAGILPFAERRAQRSGGDFGL